MLSPAFALASSSSLLQRTAGAVYHVKRSLHLQVPIRSIKTQASSPIPWSFKSAPSSSTSYRATPNSCSRGMGGDDVGRFLLSPKSLLYIHKGDITVWSVNTTSDAIVNAANERMLGGGGVDGAIHRAAGPELRAACREVPEVRPGVRCPTGEARITPAFRLPVAYVIHTVGPVYDADDHPEFTLRKSYRTCMRLAKVNGIDYIAFPAISCGVFGYPLKEASSVAISAVKEFSDDFKEVHFVLFSDDVYEAWLDCALELLPPWNEESRT